MTSFLLGCIIDVLSSSTWRLSKLIFQAQPVITTVQMITKSIPMIEAGEDREYSQSLTSLTLDSTNVNSNCTIGDATPRSKQPILSELTEDLESKAFSRASDEYKKGSEIKLDSRAQK